MALKTIMLRRSIDLKKKQLKELLTQDESFKKRETELEAAIEEAETEEVQKAVSEEIDRFEDEKQVYVEEVNALDGEIEALEKDLTEMEQITPPVLSPDKRNERSHSPTMKTNIRSLDMNVRAFDALSLEERSTILGDAHVREFLSQLRSMKGQNRAVSGAELTIPTIMLELIAENMYRYSKLLRHVRVRTVAGEARQTIAGTVPEAVWAEMCSAINEMSFVFNQITLDGYKVAGYVPVCNSLLEDNDMNLTSWIVEMLSESLGLAQDKAILYGKGSANRMPLGIVTRLAQNAKPADYPSNAPAWVDLHTSNILSIAAAKTGAEFWAELQVAVGNTFTRYSRGKQFWAMNSRTYALLKSKAITFTAAGDVVANVYGILPIVSGDIEILEFMPDGDIVGGYGDLYLYAQRSGISIEASREVQFIQDNTVFRGKTRGDGTPVIPGAFVAININGSSVTTVMDFAADTANEADLESISGLTLSPGFDAEVTSYAATMTAAGAVSAVPSHAGASVEMVYNGKTVLNGGTLTPVTGTNPLTITVKNGNAVKVYTVAITKS